MGEDTLRESIETQTDIRTIIHKYSLTKMALHVEVWLQW